MTIISFLTHSKTNHSNAFLSVGDLSENVINYLVDKTKMKEDLFGLEKFVTNSSVSNFAVVHPSTVTSNENVVKCNDITLHDNLHIISLVLEKNSLFPLNLQPYSILFNEVNSLSKQLEDNDYLIFQLLFKMVKGTWREEFISQYTDYLNGVDNPLPNKYLRILQRKVIMSLDKVASYETIREPVQEIEQKIMEEGYQFEFRIAISSEKNYALLKNKIEELLIPYAFYNSLKLNELNEHKFIHFMQNRVFSIHSKGQILSKSELLSLFARTSICSIPPEEKIEEPLAREEAENTSEELNLMTMLPEGKIQHTTSNEEPYLRLFTDTFRNLQLIDDNDSLMMNAFEEGATLRKLTLSLPKGIKLSEIKSNAENIQAQTGIEYIEINKGSTPGSVSFMFPKEKRSIVYLKDLLTNHEFIKFLKKSVLPFSIGTDETGTPIYIDLAKVYHLLIAGSTGSGKSVFLVQLLLTLILVKKPSELQLYMIDPKRVELKKFKDFPHVKELVYEADEALVILNSLVIEMERRYEILDEHDVDELSEYNKKKPKNKLPYIICVIDEFADLIMLNEDVKHSIVRLGQKARACGIHLICATQRPEAKIVDGLIKANLPTKISFRCSSINDYKTVFGTSQPYHLLGNGDGSIKLEGAAREFIRFQGPVIHEDKSIAQKCLKQLAEMIEDDGTQGITLLDNLEIQEDEVEPLDKLKTIIAETGETRISQLQKEMKMRINTVQELMATLVEEGWLLKHKAKSKGYELIASEEELDKWRNLNE